MLYPSSSISAHLLDVVVAKSSAILELLSGEDQSLLVRRNALLILNLALDVVDGVGRLHLEGDSLAREGLHETVMTSLVSLYCGRLGGRMDGRGSGHVSPRFTRYRIGWEEHTSACLLVFWWLMSTMSRLGRDGSRTPVQFWGLARRQERSNLAKIDA